MPSHDQLSAVFIGEESLVIQCATVWRAAGHEVTTIVSSVKNIVEWAEINEINHIPFDKKLSYTLEFYSFDYLFSIANLKVVPAAVLKQPKKGAINFHDGVLPAYAGLYTTSWALANQEQSHGITWHWMAEKIDAGGILLQQTFPLAPDETAFSLNVKCYEVGISTFHQLVGQLTNESWQERPQNLSQQTYYGKDRRPLAGGIIDWSQPGKEIDALYRALSFGGYDNPLALAKIYLGAQGLVLVFKLELVAKASNAPSGTILSATSSGLLISAAGNDVQIQEIVGLDGRSLTAEQFLTEFGFSLGDQLPVLDVIEKEALTRKHQELSRHEDWWRKQLRTLTDFEVPYAKRQFGVASQHIESTQLFSEESPISRVSADEIAAACGAYFSRLTSGSGQVLFRTAVLEVMQAPFSSAVPLAVSAHDTIWETLAQIQRQIRLTKKRVSYPHDLLWRDPELAYLRTRGYRLPLSIMIEQNSGLVNVAEMPDGIELLLQIDADSQTICWVYDNSVYSAGHIELMQQQLATFLTDVLDEAHAKRPFNTAALLNDAEKQQMLYDWNETTADYEEGLCIHELFVARAAEMPEATAVIFRDLKISYAELDQRSNQVAHHLVGLGVSADVPVGIYMERGIDLIVALYGVHKAGGAYLPLDPDYPADRLAFMVEDTKTPVLITQSHLVSQLPPHEAAVVALDGDWSHISQESIKSLSGRVESHHMSYIIYTSGSTGMPKGVMVEHRNVVNFFAGMDARIPHKAGDVWLAVTSLSFDISVLELFWTLCRGLTVVLYDGKQQAAVSSQNDRPIDFSLYYFASDEGEQGLSNKYEILLEGAKFADQNGFQAIWTPERHFHAFGGLYPNPSVMGAALATMTEHVQIRAGSCVLPLHHPARVAEEWAVVDNLSNGRVGISFAAGWQPNDFIFQPEQFADRKAVMFRDIEIVQQLWRGETVEYVGGNGPVSVRTLPRPVQAELPVWVTAAGNPETFRMAGENGFNLLTHLLGQSIAELTEKLAIYRQAWQDAGHSGSGHVTILLHTFIGENLERVKEIVREPMTEYLKSSLFLIRQAAWSFPTFKQRADESGRTPMEVFDQDELSQEEMDALLAHSFERYFEHSSMLGTSEKAIAIVDQLKEAGVDEVACQIDFGVPTKMALNHLPLLNKVRMLANPQSNNLASATDYSIPALIDRHQVTHFQCTPSMMSMLLVDERQKDALAQLQVCMLGGEALSQVLAGDVLSCLPSNGQLINMYGPTETTIWSATFDVTHHDDPISIGRPIANTDLFIVDKQLNPVPVGIAGELLIGGAGVVRGYLNRSGLTAERFVRNHFRADQGDLGARMYRTGDLARYRSDGLIEFLGRIDFQVKLRGYRIELGEIESLLGEHDSVRDVVVDVREDVPGDKRMVAYVIPQPDTAVDGRVLREHLKDSLPDFMIPAHFIEMNAFPLTPNKKTDRKALPAPNEVSSDSAVSTAGVEYQAPENEYQEKIAEIWRTALGLPRVGIRDNFFEVGGHSILAVQVHRQIREKLQADFSIADMFRYATIASLSDFLGNQDEAVKATREIATDRARKRREAMGLKTGRRRRR